MKLRGLLGLGGFGCGWFDSLMGAVEELRGWFRGLGVLLSAE